MGSARGTGPMSAFPGVTTVRGRGDETWVARAIEPGLGWGVQVGGAAERAGEEGVEIAENVKPGSHQQLVS